MVKGCLGSICFRKGQVGDGLSAGLPLQWSRGVQQFALVLMLHSLELFVSTSVQFSDEGGPALVLRTACAQFC